MSLSTNIAAFQNCGTERYKCIESKKLTVYIDVVQNDDSQYTATLQYGKPLSWVSSSCYTSRTKKKAALMAFDCIMSWVNGDKEILNDVYCPDILRPYKSRVQESAKEIMSPLQPLQLNLF